MLNYGITAILTFLICGIGLVGNALCFLVLFNKRTHASSYKYILVGLTVSDTSLLVLSILRTARNVGWVVQPSEGAVPVVLFFWDWMCTAGTKYYTVAISLERCFVVWYPLRALKCLTPFNAKMCAVGVCGFCLLLTCFSYVCVNWIDDGEAFKLFVAVVLHFAPFLLVLVFNSVLFVGLRRYAEERKTMNTSRGGQSSKSASGSSSEESVTRMLFAVVLVFGICDSFEFVRKIMNFAWRDYMTQTQPDYYDYTVNHLADIFYVLNSSVNFLVYCFTGKAFRSVFIAIVKGWWGGCEHGKCESGGPRKSVSAESTCSVSSSVV